MLFYLTDIMVYIYIYVHLYVFMNYYYYHALGVLYILFY